MTVFLALAAIVAGFAGLIWSADRFVLGASTTARNLGVSPLVIGLTIVAFGTSSPEIFTSAVAALEGSPEIALGNVIGSNIANIGLVLGLTLLVSPVSIPDGMTRQEIPVLALLTGACFFLFMDLELNAIDGVILLVMLGLFSWNVYRSRVVNNRPDARHSSMAAESEIEEFLAPISTGKALVLMTVGLVLMIVSSNILIYGARSIAMILGMSELVIGLTIVAIGTSLPELATSISSARRGHHELALGNIVGSNILNLLIVLPVPAFLSPFMIESQALWRDYMAMAFFTAFLCLMVLFLAHRKHMMGRKSGAVLMVLYIAYTALLLFKVQ